MTKITTFDLDIPNYVKSIRFDIGLSYCAPNSAVWLSEDDNVFVFGVEPNRFCVETIKKEGVYCDRRGRRHLLPNERFRLIECALDNVSEPTEQVFYHMKGDPGTSSLLKPTRRLKYRVREKSAVWTMPFSSLLDNVPWDRFAYVELVKTDTQGKDLDILRSAGDYLHRIVYINAEVNTFGCYENSPSPVEFNEFITDMGFVKLFDNSIVRGKVVDSTYINTRFLYLKDSINCFVL